MPIDFDELSESLNMIQLKVDKLSRVVALAKEGKVADINFTTAQLDSLKSMYSSLKVEIASIFQGLP